MKPRHSSDAEADVDFYGVIATYSDSLVRHGPTAAGVQWESAARQAARFDIIASLFEGPFSVNDFGCGYGALYDHLVWRLPLTRYIGTDVTPAMINTARARITDPRAEFICAPRLTRLADYSVASGLFALPVENDRDRWRAWTFDALRMMWEWSRRGMAFNVLHLRAMDFGEEFYGADAGEYADWCRSHLSPDVEVVTPVDSIDSTILVRREGG